MAACRAGDMPVVIKLDRLARSLPDARDSVDELTAREVGTKRNSCPWLARIGPSRADS